MAFYVTNYGLVYNDDGSLCVTIREDYVPFAGVRSFVVEEGTINHADSSKYANAGISVPDTKRKFAPVHTGYLSSTNDWDDLYHHDALALTLNDKESITISAWIYIDDTYGAINLQLDTDLHPNLGIGVYYGLSRGWHYLTWHYTNTNGQVEIINSVRIETNMLSNWASGQVSAYIANVQIEKKPYATSFVIGTRPDGILKTTQPIIDINNFIIHAWVKNIRCPSQTGEWLRFFDISFDSTNYYGIELCAPPTEYDSIPANILSITDRRGTHTYTRYQSSYNLQAFLNQWHMITLVGIDGTIKFYVDDTEDIAFTHQQTKTSSEFIVFGRWFGNVSGTGKENGFLMSNLYIGKAKEDGSLIWTDEYIKKVYEARKPFSD